jgi:rod shape-determining protein MreC
MRNVLNFLIRYNSWFLFVLLLAIGCMLLVNFNDYQQSYYLSSANAVCSSVNGIKSDVTGYIGLKEANAQLEQQNAELSAELLRMKGELLAVKELVPDSNSLIPQPDRFSYIVSTVLNNSVQHAKNYFTINKGKRQGVAPGMGVVSHQGVVGIVNVCGDNTARVISVLNVDQHFSVKLKGTSYIGSLYWLQGNPEYAYMGELPRHAKYKIGDVVVSSGFSTTFPEGVPVGKVVGRVKSAGDNFYTLKVKLLPDFERLETVWVINDIIKSELDSLENFDAK